jgi:chromosome partitioning protein
MSFPSRIIAVLGSKGGTGKTTIAHLLGVGFAAVQYQGEPVNAAVLLTDPGREPVAQQGRRYRFYDARTPERLRELLERATQTRGWVLILDGGGNRPAFDEVVAQSADLVLLPFRDSAEDARTVAADLRRLPMAYGLPSQWPTNAYARPAAERLIRELLGEFVAAGRLLPPVNACRATNELLKHTLDSRLATVLLNEARALTGSVWARLRAHTAA